MTAAAASTWRAVSLDRLEARQQQLARARGKRPVRVGAERVEVLDEQERQPLGLLVEPVRERLRPARGLQQLADLALAESRQLDRRPADRAAAARAR